MESYAAVMKKMKLAQTLKTLLNKLNLSESELARQTGICQPVIHRMASGETDNPKIETLRPIAKFFSISLEQLIGDEPLAQEAIFHVEQEWFNVPLITLKDAIDWPHHKTHQTTNIFIQTDIKTSEFGYAIRLKDSTMYPMFPDGTLLIIEPNQASTHRDFVVAHLSNEPQAIFKQLLIDGKNYYLKSVNKDYPRYKLGKNDKIIGVMLQARIDFRKN
jgi:SOS-response transcriptional repressor LexA